MNPNILKRDIKINSQAYIQWLKRQPNVTVPVDYQVLSRDFQFSEKFRYLNFHPDIMEQAKDLLTGRVD